MTLAFDGSTKYLAQIMQSLDKTQRLCLSSHELASLSIGHWGLIVCLVESVCVCV